jgi:hypothetical protein
MSFQVLSLQTSESILSYQKDAAGVFLPETPVVHREEEYDSEGFDLLNKNLPEAMSWKPVGFS